MIKSINSRVFIFYFFFIIYSDDDLLHEIHENDQMNGRCVLHVLRGAKFPIARSRCVGSYGGRKLGPCLGYKLYIHLFRIVFRMAFSFFFFVG